MTTNPRDLLRRDLTTEERQAIDDGEAAGRAARDENDGKWNDDAMESAYEDFRRVWYDKNATERERSLAFLRYDFFKHGHNSHEPPARGK